MTEQQMVAYGLGYREGIGIVLAIGCIFGVGVLVGLVAGVLACGALL